MKKEKRKKEKNRIVLKNIKKKTLKNIKIRKDTNLQIQEVKEIKQSKSKIKPIPKFFVIKLLKIKTSKQKTLKIIREN